MATYHQHEETFTNRGITLNSLRDELCSLNMRIMLAMQNHDETMQEELEKQLVSVQTEISRMCLGTRC